MSILTPHDSKNSLASLIAEKTSISVSRCYQCGKCSAGCPVAIDMDVTPSVLLRHLQWELPSSDAVALSSYTIWLCLSCHTCATRCPMEVDLPSMMDLLRSESMQRDTVNARAKDILSFHRSFMNTVERFGRLWEIGLIGEYKLRTLHLFKDVLLAPAMLMRGKLSLLPERVKGKKATKRIFDATRTKEGRKS